MGWTLAFLIVLLSSLIQTCTGFGFAIMAIPLLVWIYPAHYAISLSVFLSLISAFSTLLRDRRDVNKAMLKRLFLGSLLGLPLGGLFTIWPM